MTQDAVKIFLERSDIKNLLIDAEKKKKKLFKQMRFLLIVYIPLFLILMYFDSKHIEGYIQLLLMGLVLGVGTFISLLSKLDPRKIVMPQLGTLIDPNFKYEYKAINSPQWSNDKSLIGEYRRINSKTNHIQYKVKKVINTKTFDIEIEGIEIIASIGSGKHKRTVCDSFITEIKFPNGILNISPGVRIKAERGSLIPGFEDSKTFGVTNNKVFLESGDFEKMFDVYCEDQVKARVVLNPHTMETLMNFIKSFDGERSYDFLFTKDSIFIKYDLLKSKDRSIFVTPNPRKNFTKDTKIFSDFYKEFLRFKNFITDFDPFYRI